MTQLTAKGHEASNGLNSVSSELAEKLRAQLALHRAEVKRVVQLGHAQQLKMLEVRCGELEQSFIDSLCSTISETYNTRVPSQKPVEVESELSIKAPKMKTVVPNSLNVSATSSQPSASGCSAASENDCKTDPQEIRRAESAWSASPKKSVSNLGNEEKPRGLKQSKTINTVNTTGSPNTRAIQDLSGQMSCFQKFQHAVKTPAFDCFIAAIILLNTVFMAFQTDWVAKNLKEPTDPVMWGLDLAFTAIFLVDLIIKLVMEKLSFFTGPARNWNIFDLFVVGTAVLEEVLVQVVQSGPSLLSNTKVMRALRILRLVRVLRVLRAAKFFRELRAMVYGIMLSFSSLFWACILGCATIFIFSVYTTQGVAFFFMEEIRVGPDPTITDETRDALRRNCGSLPWTMYSLWKAISGGSDWGDVADPLFEISPTMGFVFTMYVIFCVCAILNVVTGVFVNKALKVAEADQDTMILENHQTRLDHMKKIKNVFSNADHDGNGRIDASEFTRTCEDPNVQAFFRYLELDLEGTDPSVLFDMLDFDGDGSLDSDEFCFGCSVLQGYARSIDLARHTFQFGGKHEAVMDRLHNTNKDLAAVQAQHAEDIKDWVQLHKGMSMLDGPVAPTQPADTGGAGWEERTKAIEQQIAQVQQSSNQVLELFKRMADKANTRAKKNPIVKSHEVEAQKHANSENID